MRKLALMTAILVLGTACPKVERKVYTFDLKTNTGVLVFENIVTDEPAKADGDFLEIVNKVIKGTKLEEENPGWNIGEKKLLETEGRLDGRMEFTFADASKAGLYKHDKKSPYIWCASREEEETVVATNGERIDELPGCVAWDRKATELSVTVRTATLTGAEQPLTDSFKRWSAGEELKPNDEMFGGLDGAAKGFEGFGEAFAGGLLDGAAAEMAGDATVMVGDPAVQGADAAEVTGALGSLPVSTLKLCAAKSAQDGKAFTETLVVTVKPDGTYTTAVKDSSADDADRASCYGDAFKEAKFPKAEKGFTLTYALSVALPE